MKEAKLLNRRWLVGKDRRINQRGDAAAFEEREGDEALYVQLL